MRFDHDITPEEIVHLRSVHDRKGIIRIVGRFVRETTAYNCRKVETWVASSDFQVLYLEWGIKYMGGIFKSKFKRDDKVYSDLKTFWDKVQKTTARFELISFEFHEGSHRKDKRQKED